MALGKKYAGQSAIECRCGSTAGSLQGQAAIEAMSYGAFFMLVFVGAVFVFLQLQSQDVTRAENAYAQQLAYRFANQVQVASAAGSGFSQTVGVPQDLLGKPYSIILSRPIGGSQAVTETGFVYIEWTASTGRQSVVSAPTITTAYSFARGGGIDNNTEGFITISSGTGNFIMRNLNGTIMVSKI